MSIVLTAPKYYIRTLNASNFFFLIQFSRTRQRSSLWHQTTSTLQASMRNGATQQRSDVVWTPIDKDQLVVNAINTPSLYLLSRPSNNNKRLQTFKTAPTSLFRETYVTVRFKKRSLKTKLHKLLVNIVVLIAKYFMNIFHYN